MPVRSKEEEKLWKRFKKEEEKSLERVRKEGKKITDELQGLDKKLNRYTKDIEELERLMEEDQGAIQTFREGEAEKLREKRTKARELKVELEGKLRVVRDREWVRQESQRIRELEEQRRGGVQETGHEQNPGGMEGEVWWH